MLKLGLRGYTPVSLTARLTNQGPPGHVGPVFELGPDGTKFEPTPATISIRPSAPAFGPDVRVRALTWATYEGGRWKRLPTSHLPDGSVEGTISHLSQYTLVQPCFDSGTKETFALVGCSGSDAQITTDVPVTLEARGGSVSLVMMFSSGSAATSNVTVSGLIPNHAYSILQDSFATEIPLMATAAGQVVFQQDLQTQHTVVLEAQPASTSLTSATCVPPLGNWESATGTCTLLQDTSSISIDEDNLTLDCAGHQIGDPSHHVGMGVLVANRTNVGLKNCSIVNVDFGIYTAESKGFAVSQVHLGDVSAELPWAITDIAGRINTWTGVSIDNADFGFIFSNPINEAITSSTILLGAVGVLAIEVSIGTQIKVDHVTIGSDSFSGAPSLLQPATDVQLTNIEGHNAPIFVESGFDDLTQTKVPSSAVIRNATMTTGTGTGMGAALSRDEVLMT